jgi:nickel/cobalt transporter (NicO) family protein
MNGRNGKPKRWWTSREAAAEMKDAVFITLVFTGFTVAFLHAAIPTHWLPFVVAARAQRWNLAKTLVVTGVAGSGHVLFTTALGVLVAGGGIALNAEWGRAFPIIAGTALILVGLIYLIRQLKGSLGHVHLFRGHSHHERDAHLHNHDSHEHYQHHHHDHDHYEERTEIETIEREWSRRRSDWAVIVGLFALLTFSPCEAFLPVFLTGAKYGWVGFFFLSALLATATVAGMVTFTWLTLLGSQRLHFQALDKYEAMIVGGIFCLLGVVIILFEK